MRAGETLSLTVEKAAAGGRMLARHEGRVFLVSGAIPGEQVQVRIDQVKGGVAFGLTGVGRRLLVRSALGGPGSLVRRQCLRPHRLHSAAHPEAGDRSRRVRRIAHLPVPDEVVVHASPERGYRMRARLHVHGDRIGFYREATHTLCDPLHPDNCWMRRSRSFGTSLRRSGPAGSPTRARSKSARTSTPASVRSRWSSSRTSRSEASGMAS